MGWIGDELIWLRSPDFANVFVSCETAEQFETTRVIVCTQEIAERWSDDDVLAWSKSQGERGYQTRMNAILQAYVQAHQSK